MEHGTGAAQYEALNNVLEDYGICDNVKGLCFDTNASNTGRHSGTNTRFSQRQESILLELACRRHIYELHLKHFWEQITSGKTAAPENLMFKRFQTNWNCIKETVDPSNLIRFDINSISNTFLATQIEETIQFCKDALNTDIVLRGDYRELLELTLMYLHPEIFFKVRAPGCVSHARFMSKAIYYLKIQILSTHLPYDLTVSQRKELKAMAEFISIFYSVWFLRTSLPSAAPFQDVKAYWQMVQYKEHVEKHNADSKRVLNGIKSTMMSMKRHTWYLDETLVPLALLDPDLSNVERENIAKTLFSIPVPDHFQHSEKSNLIKELNFKQEVPPGLARLIGENSWFIFSLLNLTRMEDKLWLNSPAPMWCYVDQFKTFSNFVSKLEVVNDSSERAVKLVLEFVNNVHNEDDRQELLLAVQQRRDQLRGSGTKEQLQLAYKAICKKRKKIT
ncbi:uncharacterized protein LOC105848737 [Hydra vulgaris]|uniref:uncharacterized protein LOC105848737 n=1 Tax=Hydra vulgaris TaxID=6087 RepID=UPI001F5F2948|nr:uncharacterized protein LOC105848737 [Hydra vulgaris]